VKNKNRIILLIGLALLSAVAIAAFFYLFPINTAKEKQFYLEADKLPLSGITTMSDLDIFHGYQAICVVSPYSIRANDRKKSLQNIFGNIEHQSWDKKIISNANDDSIWVFYPVQNKIISEAIRIKSVNLQYEQNFKAGCYQPESLCVQKRILSDVSIFVLSDCNSN
jgi:hypothetical protein